MRDSTEALKIALARIRTGVRQGRYAATTSACSDFIKLSYQLDRKPELFLGEVLESVCLQIGNDLHTYAVPRDARKDLQEKMDKHLDRLLAAYDAQEALYDILIDIRYEATVFQFETWLKYDRAQQVRRNR